MKNIAKTAYFGRQIDNLPHLFLPVTSERTGFTSHNLEIFKPSMVDWYWILKYRHKMKKERKKIYKKILFVLFFILLILSFSLI